MGVSLSKFQKTVKDKEAWLITVTFRAMGVRTGLATKQQQQQQ